VRFLVRAARVVAAWSTLARQGVKIPYLPVTLFGGMTLKRWQVVIFCAVPPLAWLTNG
jgi:hypothetical protein